MLSDETRTTRKVPIAELFAGPLRAVTPLLWLGFFMSSLGVFFTSSFGPTVLERIGFPRPTAALVKSSVSLVGAAAGLLLMRFTDRKGPIALAVRHYPHGQVGSGKLTGGNAERRVERLLEEAERIREKARRWRESAPVLASFLP